MKQRRDFIKELSEQQRQPSGMVLVDMDILKTDLRESSPRMIITESDRLPTESRIIPVKHQIQISKTVRKQVLIGMKQAVIGKEQLLDSMKGNREHLMTKLDQQRAKLDIKNAEAFKRYQKLFQRPEGIKMKLSEASFRQNMESVPKDLLGSIISKKNMSPKTHILNEEVKAKDSAQFEQELQKSKLEQYLNHLKVLDLKDVLLYLLPSYLQLNKTFGPSKNTDDFEPIKINKEVKTLFENLDRLFQEKKLGKSSDVRCLKMLRQFIPEQSLMETNYLVEAIEELPDNQLMMLVDILVNRQSKIVNSAKSISQWKQAIYANKFGRVEATLKEYSAKHSTSKKEELPIKLKID